MEKINKIDREVLVLDFLMRNKEYAYDIDEIQKSTNIGDMEHEEIIEFKDVECRTINDMFYYKYVPFETQVKEVVEQLVKDNEIKLTTINGVTKYSIL